MRCGLIAAVTLLLASCGSAQDGAGARSSTAKATPVPATPPPAPDARNEPKERWSLESDGEGIVLALLRVDGSSAIRLACPPGEHRLIVSIPGFRPVGSEDRLSFGSGGDAVALVAGPHSDGARAGVSATGEVPRNLATLINGRLSASYGAQTSGPHPVAPQDLSHAFVSACGTARAMPADVRSQPTGPSSACHIQGGERLRVTPRRVIGTEPFWTARIEGRCVTYAHPENQDGTRVWTRYTEGPQGSIWSGALGGQPFQLRLRSEPDCSDGMSDRRYPLAAELRVDGEVRKGCAESI